MCEAYGDIDGMHVSDQASVTAASKAMAQESEQGLRAINTGIGIATWAAGGFLALVIIALGRISVQNLKKDRPGLTARRRELFVWSFRLNCSFESSR